MTQTRVHEPSVLDEDTVKAKDFIKRKRIPAGLQDRTAPSLQAVARRTLALDLETGLAVGQQHEAGSARDQLYSPAIARLTLLTIVEIGLPSFSNCSAQYWTVMPARLQMYS